MPVREINLEEESDRVEDALRSEQTPLRLRKDLQGTKRALKALMRKSGDKEQKRPSVLAGVEQPRAEKAQSHEITEN
jgi:hypothetical protein